MLNQRGETSGIVCNDDSKTFARDLANRSKHLSLTSTRNGDRGTEIKRNDATVFVGTGAAAHRFYIESGDVEHDVLDVAEAAVAVADMRFRRYRDGGARGRRSCHGR